VTNILKKKAKKIDFIGCTRAPNMPLYITFMSYYKHFICAEKGGAAVCDRSTADDWECIEVNCVEGCKYTLRSYHGKYLTLLNTSLLVFKSEQVTPDCIFEVRVQYLYILIIVLKFFNTV